MSDEQDCPKCPECAVPDYMGTYGDMVTLLMAFFVLMMNPEAPVDTKKLELIMYAFNGLGPLRGGNTLESTPLAEMGNDVMAFPSTRQASGLEKARETATSLFKPEIDSEMVRVTEDERGLVITLAADVLFGKASADVNVESARGMLEKLSSVLSHPAMSDRTFRIEGHTDSTPTDPNGPWETNWELSTERANNVLHYLVDFGVDEMQFQTMGLAHTRPLVINDTSPEGQAYNRRVDIVVLSEGHL